MALNLSLGEGDDIQLKGATDGTLIGNVGDRLKVDANFSTLPTVALGYRGSAMRFMDMNAANGGVARGTAINSTVNYTTVFNISGSGTLFSFLVTLEGNLLGGDPFNVKLEIDGTEVFVINTDDIGTNTIYNLMTTGNEDTMGMSLNTNVFRFAAPRSGGFTYSSSIKVSIKKAAGGSKLFRAGAVYLTRDTIV